MLIKVHRSYRIIVAICDTDLLGKSFEEDIRQLKVNEHFFKGQEVPYTEAVEIIKKQMLEDASFNIVGKEAIKAAQEANLITKENITTIQGMPYALTF
jgi:uncharacterized protein